MRYYHHKDMLYEKQKFPDTRYVLRQIRAVGPKKIKKKEIDQKEIEF